MSGFRRTLLAGALLALPALGSGYAETGSVAYPNKHGDTPSAKDGGKPIAMDKQACTTPGCPAVPKAALGNAGDDTGKDQKAGIRTPATAYPDGPVETPATAPGGNAPR